MVGFKVPAAFKTNLMSSPGSSITMDSALEITTFIQTWLLVYMFLTYTYFVGKIVSPGKTRFSLISPVVILFLLLPLRLTSIHLRGTTAFFIAWLATFKLILFSFNKGPLSSSISLLPFLATASLPIKITPSSKLDLKSVAKTSTVSDQNALIWKTYVVKVVVVGVVFKLYNFTAQLHPAALMTLYCLHIYLMLEFILAILGAAARAGLGIELEPQFNEPYKATSLADFWGRRWNLVVTGILRPTVYFPLMGLLKSPMGLDKARSIATLATFGVLGMMHEYMMYHFNRMYPTGRMSAFFLLHGLCVVVETVTARQVKWRVPKMVSSGMTIFFVMSTSFWLFFPDFMRGNADVRALQEYEYLGEFIKRAASGDILNTCNGFGSVRHIFQQIASF